MTSVALFRCDAGPAIGGGHVVRCLALAGALGRRGWTCRFACAPGTTDTVPALAASGWEVVEVEGDDDPGSALRTRTGVPADLLVVDHYGLDAAFEQQARSWARSVAVIDDLADRRHDCDLLLDQTVGREASDYAALVPPGCTLLLGTGYALLRPDFARLREGALARRDGRVRRVHVCMGASDPHGLCALAVEAVGRWGGDVAVDVVLGSARDRTAALDAAIRKARVPVEVHVATSDMAQMMAGADLAIGSAGTVSWERCAVGLPAVLVVAADNQRLIASRLVAQGAAVAAGDWRSATPASIGEALASCAADPDRLRHMSAAAAALCDGMGAERVAGRLAERAA